MAQAWLRAVADLCAHAFDDIVLRVAVGEAVGHEQVEDIGIGEALMVGTGHGTLLELVAYGFLLAVVGEGQFHRPRLRPLEVEIDEQVVW